MLTDLRNGLFESLNPTAAPSALLSQSGARVVTYDDWKKIDQMEIERGAHVGKPREKFTEVSEFLSLLD